MNVGLDPEALFAIYADWIAFLREKRITFEGQLAKVQGKDVPIKEVADQPSSSNGKTSEARLGTTDTLLSDPHLKTSSKKEKKSKTVTPAPVLAGTASPDDPPPMPEPEIEPPLDEKTDEIPEWLWNSGAASNKEDEELQPSVEADEDDQIDDWM